MSGEHSESLSPGLSVVPNGLYHRQSGPNNFCYRVIFNCPHLLLYGDNRKTLVKILSSRKRFSDVEVGNPPVAGSVTVELTATNYGGVIPLEDIMNEIAGIICLRACENGLAGNDTCSSAGLDPEDPFAQSD
jgi:hypothetical protein